MTSVGDTVYFSASDGKDSVQLWSSNGTSTVMVTNANPGLGFFPQDLTNVNGTLYVVGYNLTDGYQVHKSDGTAAGTVRTRGTSQGVIGPTQTAAAIPSSVIRANEVQTSSATSDSRPSPSRAATSLVKARPRPRSKTLK